jgi:hypothetical protein
MELMMTAARENMIRNLASYSLEGRRQREISLEEISDELEKPDVGFVWVGLYEPDSSAADEDAGGVRPAPAGDRGSRSTRTSARSWNSTATRCSWWCARRDW